MVAPPPVTAIIVCYNHSRFVLECLQSVSSQDYPNLQMIVVDDRSTDGSAELIADWLATTGEDALFLRHRVNVGLTPSLNEGLSHAVGKYVTYIAADDAMTPGRLPRHVAAFETFPDDVAVLYSDAFVIDEEGNQSPDTYGERLWWFSRPPEGDVFADLLRLNFICAPSALVRASCLHRVGGYDESLLLEDWDLWLRLARTFEFRYSPYVGVRYRDVSTSVYHTRRAELARSKIAMLEKWLDDPDYRPAVITRLRGEVHHLYDLDRKASLPHLRLMCDLQPGWQSVTRYLLARAGISRRTQQRLRRVSARGVG